MTLKAATTVVVNTVSSAYIDILDTIAWCYSLAGVSLRFGVTAEKARRFEEFNGRVYALLFLEFFFSSSFTDSTAYSTGCSVHSGAI